MKATAVQTKVYDLPSGECCMCKKKLTAPWGRNGLNGADWVCGKTCQEKYDEAYRRWLHAAKSHSETVT